MELLWKEGKRLKPREVVAEFERHLRDELDLMLEAANASQLRRNFTGSRLLRVPEVYWDWCSSEVMVMERMVGTPISQVDELRAQGIDIPQLARDGVEIFFRQVFRDGFFHADMHPGNILVDRDGSYIALDFGIMGTLTEADQNYLAQNFLAFFRRDYRRVAQAHLEAGWVPKDTRVEEFENAIRAVCEPVFDRPLKEISFGRVLLRLFQTSRRFNVGDPAATGLAAEDPAQHRRAGARPRSRAGPVDDRQALPRALDVGAGGLARASAPSARRSAILGRDASSTSPLVVPAALR